MKKAVFSLALSVALSVLGATASHADKLTKKEVVEQLNGKAKVYGKSDGFKVTGTIKANRNNQTYQRTLIGTNTKTGQKVKVVETGKFKIANNGKVTFFGIEKVFSKNRVVSKEKTKETGFINEEKKNVFSFKDVFLKYAK